MTLRGRLLLATATAVLLGLAIVNLTTYLAFGRSQLKQVDDALTRAHPPIEALASAGNEKSWNDISLVAPGLYVAILDADQKPVFVSGGRRPGDDSFEVDPTIIDRRTQFQTQQPETGDEVRVRVDPMSNGSVLIVGESLHEVNETRRRLAGVLGMASGAAVVLALALSWVMVQIGLRPLREVESRAAEISDADLSDARVPGADQNTEVGSLAATLNQMLDRLDDARTDRETTLAELTASEARMRQFVADASHELRTPIAATAAYAELFEQGARDRPADLERSMAGIRAETSRMSELVSDLLLLARLDEEIPVATSTVDLTEIVLQAADTARTIDPNRPLGLSIEGVVTVAGDATRLRQVVDNLLANVRAHTPSETGCELSLAVDGTDAVITVSDSGPGVSAETLSRLTDRFFRVDDSRTRTSGGSGLGLSIVRSIVAAHGGTMTAGHHDPHGLSIMIRLPQGAVAEPANEDSP